MSRMFDRKFYIDQLSTGASAPDVQVSGVGKLLTAFPVDLVGDFKPPLLPAPLLITTDNVPDAPDTVGSTNPTITVGAPSIVSTIDTLEDQDFYQVTLNAGVTYDIGMYLVTGGPSGTPLPDSFIEIYDADGNFVVDADGNGPNTPQGLDALLAFTPSETGVYYVNARAFDQDSTNGDNGDGVGDYEVFVNVTPPEGYHPYYDPRSPLYAIDWGTQVDKVNTTARNPDGDEGTRDTGNAQGTPTFGSALDVPALAAAQGVDTTGKNVITIYFAQAGDVFVSNDPTNPGLPPATITAVGVQQFEHDAVITALSEFAKVADVVYLEVDNRDDADFIYTSYQGTPGPGVSLLGSMSPPGESDEGLAQFNSGDSRWNARDLAQGGFSFVTLIHEFGHGHGLAHPHDNGGHSGIMYGVEPEGPVADYTTGDFDLNQGVFTMMSYEDGWQTSPYGNAPTNVGYGYLGGLSAFDIAAIQDKYGVNEDYNTGNNTYTMKDVNAAGTYYSAIWDGGGTDQIVYSGARNANIDLRAASLEYEFGGGGWVSFATGIFGGFTIANGVTIENATSGSGNDTLIGNDVANRLSSGAGNDRLDGRAGADILTGGVGNDTYVVDNASDFASEAVGGGTDLVESSVTYTLRANVENLTLTGTANINGAGNELNNVLRGNAGNNSLNGLLGADIMYGGLGDDIYVFDDVGDRTFDTGGHDRVQSAVQHTLQNGIEDLFLTGSASVNGAGNSLDNSLNGNSGNNMLNGLAGADTMRGGDGNDIYIVDNTGDVVQESSATGGDDRVQSSVAFTLGGNLEDLYLTGAGNIGGTGNGLDNEINGNGANNDLNGLDGADTLRGGAGADSLHGGLGNDVLNGSSGSDGFYFDTALGAGNVDRIEDFSTVADTIFLENGVFTGLATGSLDASAFVVGSAAADASDRIIYNAATGALLFDADGSGAGAAVQFAQLASGLALTSSEFTVI